MGTMRVAEYDQWGGPEVIAVRAAPVPRPGRGEVLVRVHAAALNPKDVLIRTGRYRLLAGRRFPKRIGYDWAGEAVEVSPSVQGVTVGAALFGMIEAWVAGACADYVAVKPSELAPKPPTLSWEQAAALPLTGLTALQALRDHAGLEPGQRVLVHGASGGVGVMAVQIAKAFGAHVTTTSSAANLELLRTLGADLCLDYAVDDPAQASAPYDVFFDVFGNRSLRSVKPMLASRATYVTTVPRPDVIADHALSPFASVRGRLVVVRSNARDLAQLGELVGRGVLRPVIDRVYPLEGVADAQRALATKRTRGKLVICMDPVTARTGLG